MSHSDKPSFWALIVTQFTGAYNDNVLKTMLTLLIIDWIDHIPTRTALVSLTGAVFVVPFLIFSMIAGRVADRVGKPRVTVLTKYWELFVIAVAIAGFLLKSIPVLMVALFVISMQATFFSPAKYGVLPELMETSELSAANAYLNLFTFSAILLGTLSSGFLVGDLRVASTVMASVSMIGLLAAHHMKPLPPAKPDEPLAWNPLRDLLANWRLIRPDTALRISVIAVNYFWLMGAILQLNVFLYARQLMSLDERMSSVLVGSVLIGIALGSVLCGKLSRGKVDLRFVPIGALGMSLFTIDLYRAWDSFPHAFFDFFMMGFFGGFYEIPLMALLQWRSPATDRGRIMATVNFLSFVAILAGSAVLWFLGNVLRLNPAQEFLAIGAVSLTAVIITLFLLPWSILKRANSEAQTSESTSLGLPAQ